MVFGVGRWTPCAVLLLGSVCLTGCKLVDRHTFGEAPSRPAPNQMEAALRGQAGVPLVVIRFDGAQVAYLEALDTAVELAQQRRADVSFDVVTVVPARGTPDEQVAAITAGQRDASAVVSRIVDDGISADHVHLSARTDASLTVREVRVYVH